MSCSTMNCERYETLDSTVAHEHDRHQLRQVELSLNKVRHVTFISQT